MNWTYVFGILVIVALVYLGGALRVLRQYERGVVFILGKFERSHSLSRKHRSSVCCFSVFQNEVSYPAAIDTQRRIGRWVIPGATFHTFDKPATPERWVSKLPFIRARMGSGTVVIWSAGNANWTPFLPSQAIFAG